MQWISKGKTLYLCLVSSGPLTRGIAPTIHQIIKSTRTTWWTRCNKCKA